MYTCERLGENATEFRFAPDDGGGGNGASRGSNSGGNWARAALAVAAASLSAQSWASKGSGSLGVLGLAVGVASLMWSLSCRSKVREESLLVVRELGVQVTTKYVDGREKSTFLDKAKIKAILINEGITMHRVVFYLAFVVEGRDKMVVAFANSKPRLHILVKIYRGTRAAILGEAEEEPSEHDVDGHEEIPVSSSGGGNMVDFAGGYRDGTGGVRGSSGIRGTDRLSKRRLRHMSEAGGSAGTGWPPPHT